MGFICSGQRARCCCSGPGLRVRMATFVVADWLGVEFDSAVGTKIKLSASIQAALTKAHADGDWDESDVPADEAALDAEELAELTKLFGTLYEDTFTAPATPKKTDKERLKQWLKAKYEDVGSKDVTSGVVSQQFKDDLAQQGMTKPAEMYYLELAMWLGRPVGEAEMVGASYRSPPTAMSGAKTAKKNGDEFTSRTIDKVLKAARESGDVQGMRTISTSGSRIS